MNYWNRKDVPHKGWMNVGSDDLESAEHVCDMCGKEEIRYVHTMYHPEVEDYFRVGCVCAEKMTNDYITAKKQLTDMKKRNTWMTTNWKKVDLNEYEEKSFNGKYGRMIVGIFRVDNKYVYHLDDIILKYSSTSKNELKKYIYERWVI